MVKDSTATYFAFFDKLNNDIAARRAREAEEVEMAALKGRDDIEYPGVDVDRERLKRQAERRERQGQLRARPHTGKQPNRARPAFGHIELGPY